MTQDIYDGLGERTEEHNQTADQSGNFEGFFKKDIKDLKFWQCKEGVHTIDVIPYKVGPNHPQVLQGAIQVGSPDYVLDLWVHSNVGPNQGTFICPNKTYHLPCPICEHVQKLRGEDDTEDLIKEIRAKRRSVFNIVCYDSDVEEDKGVQIWEVAHFFFAQKIAPLAKSSPRGGGVTVFAHPKKGKSITFERKGKGKANTSYEGHKFEDRTIDGQHYDIAPEILAEAKCLDDLIVLLPYKDLAKIYFGGESEEGKPVEAPMAEAEAKAPAARRRNVVQEAAQVAAVNVCPAQGFTFGKDWDSIEPCQTCKLYDPCADDFEKKWKDAPKAEAPPPAQVRRRRR